MSPELATFLFETANFLLLAGALGWVLFRPVRRALDAERTERSERDRASQKLRAEAEALAEEVRHAKHAANQELETRRQEVLDRANSEASQLLEAARQRQAAQQQALERELSAARAAETAELTDVVANFAADVVRRLLETLPGPSLDLALVKAACRELESIAADARPSAQVESARALDDEARGLLAATLGARPSVRVVSELGAGVRVTTQAGQVDATAVALARYAARAIRKLSADSEAPASPQQASGPRHG